MGLKSVSMVAVLVVFLPGLALAQTEWVEFEGNPVLPAPGTGVWDEERYITTVIVVDGTYHLYYSGTTLDTPVLVGFQIGHATSHDGVSWELDPANPILTLGSEGEWNTATVGPAAVIHDGSEFRMWYCGSDGTAGNVGYATSSDGSVWTEHPGNPVFEAGAPGSFDDQGVWPGTVILDGGIYRMWYTGAKELGPNDYDWRIGYAESDDGLSWTRNPEPVLDPGLGWEDWLVYHPSVVFEGSDYHMWYSAHNGGSHVAIGYAVSPDGLTWTKSPTNPVIDGPGQGVAWTSVVPEQSPITGAFSMWYINHNDFSFRLATSDCCSTSYASFIPAAAYAAGAEGSFYETDVDLSNAGSTAVVYRFAWLPRGEDNSEWIRSDFFTLGAGMGLRYNNVLAEVFDLEVGAFGALVVEHSSPHLIAMARVSNIPADGDSGTFGQAVPAITFEDFIVSGDRRRIIFGTEHDDMRTNIGCQNLTAFITPIQFELLASDGTSLEIVNMMLLPWSNDQINRIFSDYQPVLGVVDVWSAAGDRAFYCYGSVLDNVTSDPTTILPQ